MAAPKGNQFWKARAKHGREKIFSDSESLWAACCEYFDWVDENPLEEAIVYQGVLNEDQCKPLMRAMTIDGLCIFLDVSRQTWYEYKSHDDYSDIINKVELIIRTQKIQGAAAGLLKENIIARETGLGDKQELSGPDGKPIQHEVTAKDVESALKDIASKL